MNEKKTVIIADDSKLNQELIAEILGVGYDYLYAENGLQLIDVLNSGIHADIILLDINMPHMNGFEVLEVMSEREWLDEIPVVVISDENDYDYLQRAYSLGATDYIARPFSSITVKFRVENTLMLYSKQKHLMQLVEKQVREHEEINNAMISIFSHTLEMRNNETGRHMLNIRDISNLILTQLAKTTNRYALPQKAISTISTISALHDIGKIAIPRKILNKPGKLTPEEWEIMKTHCINGDCIITTSSIPQTNYAVKTAREICRWHHERWDGNGYPDGLAGDEIPISAQVVSIADVYDALTSDRCYKKAFTHEEAMHMILSGECGVFNPLLLTCLKAIAPRLKALSEQTLNFYDYENELQSLTLEALKNEALPLDDRAEQLLKSEKEKKEFFASALKGLQFEYDCASKKVIFKNWYEENSQPKVIYTDESKYSDLLTEKDWNALVNLLKATTPENPCITLKALVKINGSYKWHNIYAKTLWSTRSRSYVGVIGQFIDINSEIATQGVEKLFGNGSSVKNAFDLIKSVFGTVQLVDPKKHCVLKITENGEFVETPLHCYEIWNKNSRCKNCSSAEAMQCGKLATKLEAKNGEIFSVISKSLKVGNHNCALEIAFSMADEQHSNTKTVLSSEKTKQFLLNFYKDSLTGAYSRMYLEDFKSSLENFEAVAVIDVDSFKQINDTYGHLIGDKALQFISKLIEEAVDNYGVVIRYGGDEFLVLCNHISQQKFNSLMQKIKERVHNATLKNYPKLQLEISIGGSYRATSLSNGIAAADREMYKNKQNNA